jgi:hypothetical protein
MIGLLVMNIFENLETILLVSNKNAVSNETNKKYARTNMNRSPIGPIVDGVVVFSNTTSNRNDKTATKDIIVFNIFEL